MSVFKAFLLTLLYFIVIGLANSLLFFGELISEEDIGPAYHIVIGGLLSLLLVALFIRKQYGAVGLVPKKTSTYFYLAAFLVGGTYTFTQALLNIPYNLVAAVDYNNEYSFSLHGLKSISILSTLVFIPIEEELFFRHYLQNKLQAKHNPYLALAVSSLLFASVHLPVAALINPSIPVDVHYAYIALFGGLLSGWLYFKSKSIGPSILFHIMWNLGATIF